MKTNRTFRFPSTTLIATAAGVAAAMCVADQAHAQTLNWNVAAGGAAATSGNWSPVGVPSAANDLVFNLNANYAVTWSAAVASSRTQVYRQGVVTNTFSSPHTVSTGITIGDTNALTGTMTLTTGTLNSTASVIVGSNAGSMGVLNVNDGDADLIITGVGADMTVGNNGDAAMNITGGGLVQVADQFVLGSNASSSPSLTITGNETVLPFQLSTLNVLGTGQSRFGAGGDVTVNISNGGVADFAGDLVVSNGSASVSTVTIAGPGGLGGIANAALDVAGDVLLGRNISAGTAAGTATMNVNADGALIVGDTLLVAGDPDGGTGLFHTTAGSLGTIGTMNVGSGGTVDLDGGEMTVNNATAVTGSGILAVSQGASFTSHGLTFDTTADFQHTGGTVSVIGGSFVHDETFLTIDGATVSDAPVLRLSAGATYALADEFNAGLIHSGTLELDDATVTSDPGNVSTLGLGSGNGSHGVMLLTNNSIFDYQFAQIVVGSFGMGELSVTNGSTISCGNVSIASRVGGVGSVLIANSSVLQSRQGNIVVGGQNSGPGGTGVLTVSNGSDVIGVGDCHVWPSGTINFNFGELTVPGDVIIDGGFNMDLGHITADRFIFGNPISVSGVIDAKIVGTSLITLASNAILGDDTPGAMNGTPFAIGTRHLTLNDSDNAFIGSSTISGGTIFASNRVYLDTGRSLSGNGFIAADFVNEGTVTATGTGLSFSRPLTSINRIINGTDIWFSNLGAPAGSFVGSGQINARLHVGTGCSITALANLSLGNGQTTGVEIFGALHCDNNTVTLNDSNGVALGELTDLNGGSLVNAGALVVPSNAALEGMGTISTPRFTVDGGTIRPGLTEAGAGSTGTLTFTEDLIIRPLSEVRMQIRGTTTGAFDRIVSLQTVALGGTLNLAFAFPFVPPVGSSYTIVSGLTGLLGTFSSENLPPGAHLRYTANHLFLDYCPADINGDGIVDFFDYLDFVDSFSAEDSAADFNRDSVIDFFDYLDFVDAFSAGC